MEIVRINLSQFEKIKDSIKELISESLMYNFPNAVIQDDYYESTLANVRKHLEGGSAIVFIALDDKKVCGWIWCHPIQRFNENRIHVANFAVFQSSRKQGVGKLLIEQVEKYVADNKYDGIDLLVTKDNVSAVSFYEKNGYEVERYLLRKELKNDY